MSAASSQAAGTITGMMASKSAFMSTKGKGGKGVAVKKEKVRRDSDGSEQIAETNDGLGHLRSSTRGGLPYTQSEVSLAQLDRAGRW